jgi:hypothetical protein
LLCSPGPTVADHSLQGSGPSTPSSTHHTQCTSFCNSLHCGERKGVGLWYVVPWCGRPELPPSWVQALKGAREFTVTRSPRCVVGDGKLLHPQAFPTVADQSLQGSGSEHPKSYTLHTNHIFYYLTSINDLKGEKIRLVRSVVCLGVADQSCPQAGSKHVQGAEELGGYQVSQDV